MNAYNPLASAQRLEAAGLDRKHAEAIAAEITEGTGELVTKAYLDERLESEFAKQFIRLGGLMVGIVVLACTVLGVVLSK